MVHVVLFGRDAQVQAIRAMFEQGARLVTLHGPAGIGKTALARAAPAGESVFCDLTEARSMADVCMVIAGALDVSLGGGSDPVAMLSGAVAARHGATFILDNAEQIAGEVAKAAAGLIEACPEARLLVTSRETLRVPEEHVLEVGPLSRESGVMLLVERGKRVRRGLDASRDDAVLGEIVTRLEGVPLAIELAASRLAVMDPKELLARIGGTLDVVSAQWRSGSDRHRSLRGAFEWSWSLLSQSEQVALVQCTVFRGGFFLEAAEAVLTVANVVDVVQSLLGKSLLRSTEAKLGPGATSLRFGMYEGVRQLAASKVEEPELAAALREAEHRHAAHYLDVGTRWDAWYGGVPDAPRLAIERDNLLAVRARAISAGSVDVLCAAIALYPPYAVTGPYVEYVALLDDARDLPLAAAAEPALAARFFLVRGRAMQLCARRPEAMASFEQSLHHARKARDTAQAARALAYLGSALRTEGRLSEARERLEASMALFDEIGDVSSTTVVLSGLAALDLAEGDLDRARERLDRVVVTQRALGDRATAAMVQVDEGIVLQELGDLAEARAVYLAALETHREVGNRRHEGITLGYLAGLDYEEGDLGAAREHYAAALGITRSLGDAKYSAVFGAALAAVLAASGELEAAGREIERAEEDARTQGESRVLAAVALHRARVDASAPKANPSELAARQGGAVGLGQQSDDVRFAARMLARVASVAPSTSSLPGAAILRVAEDGSWFEPPGGGRVDIARRAVHRRLVLELVRRRLAAPGETLRTADLVAAGWPGERLAVAAGTNRLHVALASLRASGLRKILRRTDEGYALDESGGVVIEREPERR